MITSRQFALSGTSASSLLLCVNANGWVAVKALSLQKNLSFNPYSLLGKMAVRTLARQQGNWVTQAQLGNDQ